MHICQIWIKTYLGFEFFFMFVHDTHPLNVSLSSILMCNHIHLEGVNSTYPTIEVFRNEDMHNMFCLGRNQNPHSLLFHGNVMGIGTFPNSLAFIIDFCFDTFCTPCLVLFVFCFQHPTFKL